MTDLLKAVKLYENLTPNLVMKLSALLFLSPTLLLSSLHAEDESVDLQFKVAEPITYPGQMYSSSDKLRLKLQAQQDETIAATTDYFFELYREALELRHEARAFLIMVEPILEEEAPIPPAQLHILQRNIPRHLKLRAKMMQIIETYRDVYKNEQSIYTPSQRIKVSALCLATALTLYDNFASAVKAYQENGQLRRLINRGDLAYGIDKDRLKEVVENFLSIDNRSEIRTIYDWIQDNEDSIIRVAVGDPQMEALYRHIVNSPSGKAIRESNKAKDFSRKLFAFTDRAVDGVTLTVEKSADSLSGLVGNSIGSVTFGEGALHKHPEVITDLSQTLKPLDILLDKTAYRLTDKFIPGYFGHVAIWLGTEEELKALGVWDSLKEEIQDKVRAGDCIVEALRSGVEMNGLQHFSNADDIAVIRQKAPLSEGMKRLMILSTVAQVGKEYDFNFDVETTHKIVCSELAYLVYPHHQWPTDKKLGRATISPDQVAIRAKTGGPFEVIRFYKEGQEQHEKRQLIFDETLADQ